MGIIETQRSCSLAFQQILVQPRGCRGLTPTWDPRFSLPHFHGAGELGRKQTTCTPHITTLRSCPSSFWTIDPPLPACETPLTSPWSNCKCLVAPAASALQTSACRWTVDSSSVQLRETRPASRPASLVRYTDPLLRYCLAVRTL